MSFSNACWGKKIQDFACVLDLVEMDSNGPKTLSKEVSINPTR
jgi:hypothetical protein